LKWIKNNRKLKEEIKMIEKLKNRRWEKWRKFY
jgi:hypothetical protein